MEPKSSDFMIGHHRESSELRVRGPHQEKLNKREKKHVKLILVAIVEFLTCLYEQLDNIQDSCLSKFQSSVTVYLLSDSTFKKFRSRKTHLW